MSYTIYIGNFGEGTTKLNGQSIRTATIYDSIVKKRSELKIKKINTSKRSILVKLRMFVLIIFAKNIIVLPGENGIIPILKLISKLRKLDKTVLIAIGGWLNKRVESKKNLLNLVVDCKVVLVQTVSLRDMLVRSGLKNVVHFPNYRNGNMQQLKENNKRDLNKVVFLSRVCLEKGTDLAIDVINKWNETRYDNQDPELILDIYGPIQEDYSDKFFNSINDKTIVYKGVLQSKEIVETLSNYRCMLFPTSYKGEGFPGVILESYISGTPVIASDWLYNSELVIENYTGHLFDLTKKNDLYNKLKFLINSDINYEKFCIEESNKYTEDNIFPILSKYI